MMEYQSIINLLANTPEQQSKFKTKNRVGIDDGSYGVYNTGSPISFETSMLRSVFRDYSDTYILVKGRAVPNNRNKKNKKKLYFICWLHKSEKSNKEIDQAKDIDVIIIMHSLTEYNDNYSKTMLQR